MGPIARAGYAAKWACPVIVRMGVLASRRLLENAVQGRPVGR